MRSIPFICLHSKGIRLKRLVQALILSFIGADFVGFSQHSTKVLTKTGFGIWTQSCLRHHITLHISFFYSVVSWIWHIWLVRLRLISIINSWTSVRVDYLSPGVRLRIKGSAYCSCINVLCVKLKRLQDNAYSEIYCTWHHTAACCASKSCDSLEETRLIATPPLELELIVPVCWSWCISGAASVRHVGQFVCE